MQYCKQVKIQTILNNIYILFHIFSGVSSFYVILSSFKLGLVIRTITMLLFLAEYTGLLNIKGNNFNVIKIFYLLQ